MPSHRCRCQNQNHHRLVGPVEAITNGCQWIVVIFVLLMIMSTIGWIKTLAHGFEFQILEAPSTSGGGEFPLLNPVFFGVGVAMEPLTKDVLAMGVDQFSGRQFAVLYTPDATQKGAYVKQPKGLFMADPVGSNLLNARASDPGIVSPMCLSANSQWIAIGMRPNGYNSSGSVLIARRNEDTSSTITSIFILHMRLFSDILPTGSSFFPGDMVCTRDMERIFVSEVTNASPATNHTARVTLFNRLNMTWVVNRTEDYINGTHADVPPLAITSNAGLYAFRSAEGNIVYVSYSNGTLVDAVDLTILNIIPKQMAISSTGRWLLVSDHACLNYAGCAFAIQFNATSKRYSTQNAVSLISPLITTTACQLGYSLTLASNQTTRHYPSVVIGAPGCPELLVGSSFEWISQVSSTIPNGTDWTTPNVTLNPFGPGVVPGIRLGAMSWSHNFMSDDQLVVAIGAPGSGSDTFLNTTNPGRVFVFKYFLPQSSSPLPNAPFIPPGDYPDDTPVLDPTVESQLATARGLYIAVIIIFSLTLIIAVPAIIRACIIYQNNKARAAKRPRGGSNNNQSVDHEMSIRRNVNE